MQYFAQRLILRLYFQTKQKAAGCPAAQCIPLRRLVQAQWNLIDNAFCDVVDIARAEHEHDVVLFHRLFEAVF